MLERNAEVLARSLLIGVTLGWRGEVLQQEFNRLSAADQNRLEALFEPHGGLSALQTDGVIASNMAEKFVLPRAANPDTGAGVSLLKLMIGQPRN